MHKSLEKFTPYLEKKLLRQVISPCGKLILFNYTDLCTYERAWDEVTLNARGTVYEIATGDIIARAFPKFFNYGELSEEKQEEVQNSKDFESFEKMDGSLGIVYYYDGSWRVNTRGSFTSDQAVKAKQMIDILIGLESLNIYTTYLVEIIYPGNRIIVDYGDSEKLVLLAAYKRGSHIDVNVADLFKVFTKSPRSNFDSIEKLQEHLATLDHTEEGYVVRLGSGERVKFKSRAYLDVARIMNNMTPLAFWKTMKNGKVNSDYLEHLPEEFRLESEHIVTVIEVTYLLKEMELRNEYWEHISNSNHYKPERKLIGLKCKEKGLQTGAMFAILDNKDEVLEKIIMKEIRPKGNVIK